jgi:SAM-dependent methyltransferase
MGDEAKKAVTRRQRDPVFAERYFVGNGVDVGAGGDGLSRQRDHYPRMGEVRDWDVPDGDGQYLATIPDNSLDFVHSSHCIEHLVDPKVSLENWLRVVKPGGYVVVIGPEEDMYEQGVFPSTFNPDHKHTFTLWKQHSWSHKSVNVLDLVTSLGPECEVIKVESLHHTHDWTLPRMDQTGGNAECAFEIVLRKRHAHEIVNGGRLRMGEWERANEAAA